MSHIHPRGGLLCIINVCRQQGLHRRHCRNQQLHINTTKRTHWLSSLLPAAVMRVSSYTLMLTQCFPATLHMVTLSTEWVKTRRGTALAGSCSLTEQETQPFAVTIVLVSDNWGGGGVQSLPKWPENVRLCRRCVHLQKLMYELRSR